MTEMTDNIGHTNDTNKRTKPKHISWSVLLN